MKTVRSILFVLVLLVVVACAETSITVHLTPQAPQLFMGETIQFEARVTGSSNDTVLWHATGGQINNQGLYHATALGTFAITATSAAASSAVATSNVIVMSPAAIRLLPTQASLQPGETMVFTVENLPANVNVRWSVSEGAIEAVTNDSAAYTAPLQAGEYTIRITVIGHSDVTSESTVTVRDGSTPGGSGELDIPVGPVNAAFMTLWNAVVDDPERLARDESSYLDGWREAFRSLRSVGIDTAVIQYTVYRNATNDVHWHVHKGSLYRDMFQAAAETGIKLILGLEFDQRYETQFPSDFGVAASKQVQLMRDIVAANYDGIEQLAGWYIPQEMSSEWKFTSAQGQDLIVDYLHGIISGAPLSAREIMVAPYFGSNLSDIPDFIDSWDSILGRLSQQGTPVTIIALQDGVGVGRLPSLSQLTPIFKQFKDMTDRHPSTSLWADIEAFDGASTITSEFSRFHCQISTVEPYVEGMVLFEFFNNFDPSNKGGASLLNSAYRDELSNWADPDCSDYSSPGTPSIEAVTLSIHDPLDVTDCSGDGTGSLECTVTGSLAEGTYLGVAPTVVAPAGISQRVIFETETAGLVNCTEGTGTPVHYCTINIITNNPATTTITARAEADPDVTATLILHIQPSH